MQTVLQEAEYQDIEQGPPRLSAFSLLERQAFEGKRQQDRVLLSPSMALCLSARTEKESCTR